MVLPKNYCETMKKLLGEEYNAYEASMCEEVRVAIRINTAKVSVEHWHDLCPFETEPVPWTEKGFILKDEAQNPAKHPYYFAGLYYIQEPSAMIPATILPVQRGDRLLDLCAAPGGKATELGAKLQGEGVLVANDISVSRGMALAKNLQIAGVANAIVTAETPANLAEHFPEYFDKILIDAPCSGEGMFRRDPHMVQDWVEHGPSYYVPIQRDILTSAYRMLRKGGSLVYSTCTFSPEEDEEMILWLLRQFPDLRVCVVEDRPGFCGGNPDWVKGEISTEEREQLERCVRIFPHRAVGEGHFAVLLQKGGALDGNAEGKSVSHCAENNDHKGSDENIARRSSQKRKPSRHIRQNEFAKKGKGSDTVRELSETAKRWTSLAGYSEGKITVSKENVLLETGITSRLRGIRCIQTGLIAGTGKKRFEPSVQLALALRDTMPFPRVELAAHDSRVIRYLKGETLQDVVVNNEEYLKRTDGYVLICVDGFALGWGKYTGNGSVKNKYYAGWRMM